MADRNTVQPKAKTRLPKKILPRKMARDIAGHKMQFVSIFLMAFLAVFIYTGIGGEWRGLRKISDDFYDETNLADVFIFGAGFSSEQADEVMNIDGVSNVERRTIIDAVAKKADNDKLEKDATLALHFVEKNETSKMHLIEGDDFATNDEDGIWVAERFTDANNLTIGDKIKLSYMGMEIEREIRGIILSPEYVYMDVGEGMTPDFQENGYAYLSYKSFPMPDYFVYSTLLVETETSAKDMESKIHAALDGKYTAYLEQSDHPSVALFDNEINQHKMMADIFPIVFLLVALLTMMTTMTRIVNNQRIQIGTLKAMGFRKSTILFHYVSYGFFLSLTGSLAGCIVGPITLPQLFYPSMSSFYTLPEWEPSYHASFIVISLLSVVLCTAVTYGACAKHLKDTPAKTLRPKAPKTAKHSIIEKTALWKRAGFVTQWNLRDATRNKTRSIMAIIGVLGCTALLVCAFGMNDSMTLLKEWQYETIYRFETKLTVDPAASDEQIQNIIDEVNGQSVMESAIEIRVNGTKKLANITVTDNTTLIQPTDSARRPISLPSDAVSMTSKIASVLKVKLGDKIEWHIYGGGEDSTDGTDSSDSVWKGAEITAMHRDPSTQGLMMTREVYESYGYTYKPTAILTAEKVTADYDGITSAASTSQITGGWDDLTEAMLIMVYLLIAGAALLSVVVLYNLGLLSYTEMERDMATLKVIGMKTKKLRKLLLTQNIWFSVIGYIIGTPIGLALIDAITTSSGDTFDFPLELTFGTALISFVITFGLSISVSLLFSQRIKRLNMVESLKSIE